MNRKEKRDAKNARHRRNERRRHKSKLWSKFVKSGGVERLSMAWPSVWGMLTGNAQQAAE